MINFSKKIVYLLTIIASISLSSCGTPPDKMGDLDLVAWRKDRGGCENTRKGQTEQLNAIKVDLIGMSSNDIIRIFGKPDARQIGERNQEAYIYFLEEGPHCEKVSDPSESLRVVFRFNAIKNLTDFNFQKSMPD